MSSVAIKLSFNGVIRRFHFNRDESFNNLVEAAVKRYPELRSEGITFTYKDEDGDVIDVSTDGDLLAAFMVLDQEGWKLSDLMSVKLTKLYRNSLRPRVKRLRKSLT